MKDYKAMTKAQLIEAGTAFGLSLTMRMRKDNMIAAIEAATDKATTDTDTTTDIIKISAALAPFEGFDGEIVLTDDTEIVAAIREGIRETGMNQLTDAHACSGHTDYGIGVYEGKTLIYVLPIKCHGSRFVPASIFGTPENFPSMYTEAPASSRTYNFVGFDGKAYACKQAKGFPIGKKYTVGKFFKKFVSEVIGFKIYTLKHSNNIDWVNARNLRYSVKPVKDLEVS